MPVVHVIDSVKTRSLTCNTQTVGDFVPYVLRLEMQKECYIFYFRLIRPLECLHLSFLCRCNEIILFVFICKNILKQVQF